RWVRPGHNETEKDVSGSVGRDRRVDEYRAVIGGGIGVVTGEAEEGKPTSRRWIWSWCVGGIGVDDGTAGSGEVKPVQRRECGRIAWDPVISEPAASVLGHEHIIGLHAPASSAV